jgi:hypothetical protein
MKYVVLKPTIQRTGPTITSAQGKTIAEGVIVEFSDKIETANETWGKVARVERQYMAISIGDDEHCAELIPLPDTNILEKLITWAKIQGFKP